MHEMIWKILSALMHSFYICFLWLKVLSKVLILHSLGHLMNFQINTWGSLQFNPISNFTMVCYHQNLIRRTLGLTISPFFMMTNLGYLGEEKSPPQINHGSIKWFLIGSNVKHVKWTVDHKNIISYIYGNLRCTII